MIIEQGTREHYRERRFNSETIPLTDLKTERYFLTERTESTENFKINFGDIQVQRFRGSPRANCHASISSNCSIFMVFQPLNP
jgi:hypothetical protein